MPGQEAPGHETSSDEVSIDYGQGRHLIPDGEYDAAFIGHDTAFAFQTPKVFLRFRITSAEHFGIELYRAYRVKDLKSRPSRGGRFGLKRTHDLFALMYRVLGARGRPDRLSLRPLKGMVFRVRTRTVRTDHQQRALPEALCYSVVDRIGDVVAGSPSYDQ